LAGYLREEGLTLLRSSIVSIGIKALSLVLVMIVAVILARRMGATEYGRLSYIQSIAFVLSAVSTLGLRDGANRIVARYAARGQRVLLGRFILFGIFLISVVSIVLVSIVYQTILHTGGGASTSAFPLAAVSGVVVTLAVLSFLAPTVIALGAPVLSFVLESIGPKLVLLIIVLPFLIGTTELRAERVLDLTILGNLVPILALGFFAFIRFRLPIDRPKRLSTAAKSGRAWLSISLPMLTSPVVSFVFSETAIILLGNYAAPADVALYQIARRLAELTAMCSGVAIYLSLPSLAKHYTLRRYDQLQRTVDITNVLSLLPSAGITLALIIGGHTFLRVFGPDFPAAYTVTILIAGGRLADQMFGPVLEVLLMTGQQAVAGRLNIVYGLANIGLNLVLIPQWGLLGAAAATAVATVLWKANLYVILRRRTPIETCLILALALRIRHHISARRHIADRL
jgi:O-antigen/teichoic acid export membrane protein